MARLSLLIYPLVAHVAVMLDQVIWAAGYLLVAVYLNSLRVLLRYRTIGLLLSVLLCAGLLSCLFYTQIDTWVIYLPPVLIPAWLAFVFLGSLRSKSALISQIAERIEGEALDPKHLQYTRWLTIIWGGVFLLMIVEAVVLAKWAEFETWSWWVHVGNYIVVGLLFALEFIARPKVIGRPVEFKKMLSVMLNRAALKE